VLEFNGNKVDGCVLESKSEVVAKKRELVIKFSKLNLPASFVFGGEFTGR
jgi:hypothetical protein